jgi:SnoaL-like domain
MDEPAVLPAEVRDLLDKQQITESLYTYCRAVDRVDRELGYSIWHDDAVVDYGDGIYRGGARGLIDHICDSHLKGIVHSHQITNILIELAGDHAFSESYVTSGARIMLSGTLVQITTRGRYLDQWSRRGRRWAIDKRFFVHDFGETRPITPGPLPARFGLDRSDPSYALFAGKL